MKIYSVTLRLQVEDRGINGSYPTPQRVMGYVDDALSIALGKSEKRQIKVKGLEIMSAAPEHM